MWGDVFSREWSQGSTIGLNVNLDEFKKEPSENGVRYSTYY